MSSADDEGSRDGEEEDEEPDLRHRNYSCQQTASDRQQQLQHRAGDSRDSPTSVRDESSGNEAAGTTPKAKKKPERRVQRTWKHFYQEVNCIFQEVQ